MQMSNAKKVVDFLLAQAKQQNQFLIDAKSDFTESEFNEAKIIIAHTMGAIYQDGLYPLLKEHPTLTPEGLKI